MRTRSAVSAAGLLLVALLTGCTALLIPVEPRQAANVEDDDDFGTAVVYAVDAEGVLVPAAADTETADVWDLFTRVVTPRFAAERLSQYRVGDAPDSDTMAYVHRDDDPELWVLAANLAYADDPDLLLSTLIHEYGHILSLSTVDVDPDATSCANWEISEGCVSPTSALARFDEQFWAGYGDEAPSAEDSDADAAYEFYLAHEEDFVSDYAATNVVEDFAESFMTFVLEPQPEGDSPVARKLEFFYGLADYVAVRDRLRAEFGLG